MSYLFLFTVTPVQDFISQSRKLKDLFGSSEILSCMTEIGLRICKREGVKEIFPILSTDNSSYPNRFLVEFENKNIDKIKKIANEIEDNLLKFLRGLNDKNDKKIEEHIENYFTFYWAISEINDNNYKKAFDEVEKNLAGAKNTKFFTQFGGGEGERGRKCSICGERNVVIAGRKLYKELKKKKLNVISDNIITEGEGLCGVCYVKRKNAKESFESTAEVALMHLPNCIMKKYPLLNKDSQLFFKENITKSYFEKNNYFKKCDEEYKKCKEKLKKDDLEECKKEYEKCKTEECNKYKKVYKKFKDDLNEMKLKQTSYYAVIMFDGDDMGEWLSGNKGNLEKGRVKEFHQVLSKQLLEFAKAVKSIVNEPKGITVYAGGEDFLGFVNINYLFDVLKELKEKWDEIVNEHLKKEFDLSEDFTFSAGVVIAHYKTPLSFVLNKVREAEKEAKNSSSKNAICFYVLKRSGEYRKGIIKNLVNEIENIKSVLLSLKDISDSFISKMEKEFFLIDSPAKYMLKQELKRLIKKSDSKDTDIKSLIESIFKIDKSFSNLINILNVIKFLNREMQ